MGLQRLSVPSWIFVRGEMEVSLLKGIWLVQSCVLREDNASLKSNTLACRTRAL